MKLCELNKFIEDNKVRPGINLGDVEVIFQVVKNKEWYC